MPYIKQEQRYDLENGHSPENSGELNYTLTTIIHDYFKCNGGRYAQINDVLGALEGAKLEFYRRVVVPYEETKRAQNGDVF